MPSCGTDMEQMFPLMMYSLAVKFGLSHPFLQGKIINKKVQTLVEKKKLPKSVAIKSPPSLVLYLTDNPVTDIFTYEK